MDHYETISTVFSYTILIAVLCIPLGIALLALRFVKRCGKGLIPTMIENHNKK